MIGFYLKKTISFFIEPYGFILLLLFLSLFFLYKKRYKVVTIFLSFGFGLYLLFAYPPFSNLLVKPLEERYHTYKYDHNISFIHVLGHGSNDDYTQPISSLLTDAALKRVVEGVIIYKKQPHAKLIFTGFAGGSTLATAKANAMVAMELGVDKKDIIINDLPKDTAEEVAYVKTLVGDAPFVVVTSAMHLPRTMALYHKAGLDPIPAPCDFKKFTVRSLLDKPEAVSLQNSQNAVHEYIGILWEKLKH
jgi:uncharacterized SAM-binding protein YcdF (DUF218 family)